MLRQIFGDDDRVLWLNGDDLDVQQIFETLTAAYPAATFRVVTPANFDTYLLP